MNVLENDKNVFVFSSDQKVFCITSKNKPDFFCLFKSKMIILSIDN